MANRVNASFWAIQLWFRSSTKLSNSSLANLMDPNLSLQRCKSHMAFVAHQMGLVCWLIELWLRQWGDSKIFVAHQASICYWVVNLWLRQCVHYWSFVTHQVDLSLWAIDLWLRECTTSLRLVIAPVAFVVTVTMVAWLVLSPEKKPKCGFDQSNEMEEKELCTIVEDWPRP